MRRADLILAALFLVLGLVAIFAIIPAYVRGNTVAGDLSPAFMPHVAAALATGAMALLLVTRLARPTRSDEPAPLPAPSWIFIATATAILAATFFLMSTFGYLAGAAAIVAGFMAIARARFAVVAGAALAFPLVLWLLFDGLLGFPLP